MNGFSLNGAVINGSALTGAVVFLPSASVTISRTLSERDSIELRGTITKSIEVDGDISKVAVIGFTSTSIQRDIVGELARFTAVYFDPVNVQLEWAPTGALNIRKRLPAGSSAKSLSVTGTMDPRVLLSAGLTKAIATSATLHSIVNLKNAGITLTTATSGILTLTGGLKGTADKVITPSANLSIGKRSVIPTANTGLVVTVDGNLRGRFRFQGQVQKSLNMTGLLTRARFLSGEARMVMEVTADLANNASGVDNEDLLMIRKPTDREMSR